ncbi:MAG: glycine cleavage system protein GcvH [Pseudomonadota bacterium]
MTTYYTEDHEWIRVEDGIGTVGITKYATDQLGDVVYVDVPEDGTFAKGDDVAVVESTKAASDVYAPASGELIERNNALVAEDEGGEGKPETVNEDPTGAGWFCKIKLSDAAELDSLMDEAAYKEFCEGL